MNERRSALPGCDHVEVRLALTDTLTRQARALTEDYMRLWYFEEEPLDPGDQQVLDDFGSCYHHPAAPHEDLDPHTASFGSAAGASPTAPPLGLAWVASDTHGPVGSVLLDRDGSYMKMSRLFVKRTSRRQGIGTALLAAVARHCDLTGSIIRAAVPQQRTDAVALLGSMGFIETGVVINHCVEMQRPPRGIFRRGADGDALVDAFHVEALVAQAERLLEVAAESTEADHDRPDPAGPPSGHDDER